MVDYCCIHIKVFFDYGGLMDRQDSKPCLKKKMVHMHGGLS
jgi:hypothetical protein